VTELLRPELISRVPSRISGLDTISKGGFLQGGVYLVWGDPGTGKTILGNQVAFAHAAAGGRAIYVTLLSESHARMQQYISSLSFFDPAVVPKHLIYINAYTAFKDGGLTELINLLRHEIHGKKATLLVLDGLAIATASSGLSELKEFILQLQAASEGNGCVSVLLTDGGKSASHPEHSMVDGIIALHRTIYDSRPLREVEILKFRGSDVILGCHAYRISDAGITIFPRIEALVGDPGKDDGFKGARTSTGIAKLDEMLHGGLPSSSTTMLLGPSGCGKTSLGLQFCCLANEGEPALIFSFYETAPRLEMKANGLGLPLRRLLDAGHLEIRWHPPTEQILDDLASKLLTAVRARGVRRLFIDGLDGLQQATPHAHRVLRVFATLANELRILNVTTLYTAETRVLIGPEVRTPVDGVSVIAENVILMRYVELRSRIYRLLSILKLRDSAFDPALREFQIARFGIDLADSPDTAEAIMGGAKHDPTGPDKRVRQPRQPER
jgi:circadian clock protein KaiC